MVIDETIRLWKYPARADKAALGAINRPLQGSESGVKGLNRPLHICIVFTLTEWRLELWIVSMKGHKDDTMQYWEKSASAMRFMRRR